jgi:hypothetical protein
MKWDILGSFCMNEDGFHPINTCVKHTKSQRFPNENQSQAHFVVP